MAYENYSIGDFEKAWFNKDYTVITEEEFNIVYTEYIDTAELYESDEFELSVYIEFISQRCNFIKLFIKCQRMFLLEFGIPFIDMFNLLKEKYGHILIWKNDINLFEEMLVKIEKREMKYVSILESKIEELEKKRKKRESEQPNLSEERKTKKSRESFIRTKNSLDKLGYTIDRKLTTVEDYAYMIKQQKEEYKESKSKF